MYKLKVIVTSAEGALLRTFTAQSRSKKKLYELADKLPDIRKSNSDEVKANIYQFLRG